MSSAQDYLSDAAIGDGFALCGLPPRTQLTTLTDWECWNCNEKRVVRLFSGSGWYEDDSICLACGENNTTYHRPFERGWRKKNIAKAEAWLAGAVSSDEFSRLTSAAIAAEMGWDDPREHDFVAFDERDVCDKCEQPAAKHEPIRNDTPKEG